MAIKNKPTTPTVGPVTESVADNETVWMTKPGVGWNQGEESNPMEYKTVIRGIGQSARYDAGVYTGAEVDAYISTLMKEGWTLSASHFLYTMNDPANPSVPLAYVFSWHLVK